jgi:hypothetical protein
LAVDGSPISKILMSPRRRVLSGSFFLDPPNNKHEIAFLISSEPKIPGAIESAIF